MKLLKTINTMSTLQTALLSLIICALTYFLLPISLDIILNGTVVGKWCYIILVCPLLVPVMIGGAIMSLSVVVQTISNHQRWWVCLLSLLLPSAYVVAVVLAVV